MPLMSSFFGKEHQDVEGWSNNDVNRLMGDIELMGVGLDDSIIKTNEKSGAKFVGNMDHVEILKENKSGNDPSWVQAVLKQVDGDKVLLEEDDVGLVTNGKAFECPNSGPLLSHDPKKVLDLHEEEMISPLGYGYRDENNVLLFFECRFAVCSLDSHKFLEEVDLGLWRNVARRFREHSNYFL
ncbi:hypothetical protein V6N11_001871 [Hibiscus sabdariffa]|uniref:Uncharacterized protein n=1 Tax=Hibiscus sabdariffa TaxID=183260 RepID=A0ABR2QUB2_9ROSI